MQELRLLPNLARTVHVAEMVSLQVDPPQCPQQFAEIQILPSGPYSLAQEECTHGLGIDVALQSPHQVLYLILKGRMGDLEFMPNDECFSEGVERGLKSGPSDDAVENIGGNVATILLLQLDLLQRLGLFLIGLYLRNHHLSLDFILSLLLFLLRRLAVLGGHCWTLYFLLIKRRVVGKGEGRGNGIKKLLRLEGRFEGFIWVMDGVRYVAVAVLSGVVIGGVEAVEVKHIIIMPCPRPTLNSTIFLSSKFCLLLCHPHPAPASTLLLLFSFQFSQTNRMATTNLRQNSLQNYKTLHSIPSFIPLRLWRAIQGDKSLQELNNFATSNNMEFS